MPTYLDQFVIMARQSTDDEINQKNSLEYQVEHCLRFAENRTLPIAPLTIPYVIERGIIKEKHTAYKTSGLTLDQHGRVIYEIERPKFQQLVQLLMQRRIRGVIALCWDRLSRNPHDDAIIKNLIARGSEFHFVQASYDNTSAGALHMDIDGMFAAHYSRVTSEKIRGTNAKLRAEGRCIYRSPVGYLDSGTDHKPFDPERAPLVRQLFERYATGSWSIQQLTRWAVTHGLTTKPRRRKRSREELLSAKDNPHQPVSYLLKRTTVANILNNPFYIGHIRHGRDWLPGLHQPLISKALFHQVQRRLKEHTVGIQYEHKTVFLYRGLVSCLCHRRYCPYEQKGHTYYRVFCTGDCTNTKLNLREDILDGLVADIFGTLCLRPEEADFLRTKAPDAWRRWEQERERECQAIHARLTRIDRDRSYLTENKTTLLREGVYTIESLLREEARLTTERDTAEEELAAASVAKPTEMVQTITDVLELARLAKDSYILATREQKRELLEAAFLELVVSDRNIAKVRAQEGIDALLNRGGVLLGGPSNLPIKLPQLYQAALQARPILNSMTIQEPDKEEITS